jgi:hypothetical protein
MSIRFQIAALVFIVVQTVLFGGEIVLVLATPLTAFAAQLMPWVIALSAILAAPLSWIIAPRLRSRVPCRCEVCSLVNDASWQGRW